MKTKFEINGCTESADDNSRRNWLFIAHRNKLNAAKKLAVSESLKSKWYEIELREFDQDGEIITHIYYQNGQIEIDMSV